MIKLYSFIRRNKFEILKFIVVGFTMFFIGNLLYFFFNSVLNLNYFISLTLTNILCIIMHYMCNKNITFKAKYSGIITYLKYLTYLILNYLLIISLGYVFVNFLNFPSKFLILYITPFTMISSYFLMKYFVF